jgi:membrane protein implicated in regulation of membrane protease activity
MYLVAIAWLYVTLMMAVAEATSVNGTLLGAAVTFVFYGLLPLSILMYILGTPGRRRARKAREAAALAAWQAAQSTADAEQPCADAPASAQPDTGGKAPAASQRSGVAPVREET